MKLIFRLIATLTALILLVSAYSGWVDPRTWAWPAIAGLAFPFVMGSVLLVAFLCLVLRQWRALVIVAGAILLAWPTIRLHAPLSGAKEIPQDVTTFRVMTYNVAGFEELEAKTLRYILAQDADFVLMQETTWTSMDFTDLPQHVDLREELEQKYPYHSQGYHDLAILSKLPYTVYNDTTLMQRSGTADDNSGYHYYAKAFDLKVAGRPLRIVNVHLQSIGLSNDDKTLYKKITSNEINSRQDISQVRHSILSKLAGAFRRRAGEAQQLRSFLDEVTSVPDVIVCGDFNDTPGSYCYRTIRGKDFNDAFADCGRWPTFTFNRDRFYFKIDHILYRGGLQAMNIRCDRAGGSDHYPQLATFALLPSP